MITERASRLTRENRSHKKNAAANDKYGVQKLTGWLASLNRFISRSAEKSLPFFKVLKGSENFQWGLEEDKAFEDLKQSLENLAVTTSLSPDAELLLYIATSSSVVSVLALLKYPFYSLFILDNGINLISKSLTVESPCLVLVIE